MTTGEKASFPNIPGYRFLEKIGEGGHGVVFRAVAEKSSEPVAFKWLTHLPAPVALQDLQSEAQLMGSLSHPNIVRVLDAGIHNDRPFLVMEYISGSSLRQMLQPKQGLALRFATGLLNRVADALHYMHSLGILHLDLKPENILVQTSVESNTPNARDTLGQGNYLVVPKITDFGLASLLTKSDDIREFSLAAGASDYCAPELQQGLPVDCRADLFSLTAITYEMITGRLPGRVFRPATKFSSHLPEALNDVLRQGLAGDAEKRYSSVAEFRDAFANALKDN